MISNFLRNKLLTFILPLLASIPTLLFIAHQVFQPIIRLNFEIPFSMSPFLMLIMLYLLSTFLSIAYYADLVILVPCLMYAYFESLKSKTSLPRCFWLTNYFVSFTLILIFIFIAIIEPNLLSFPLPESGELFYNFIYGILLFLIGIACSTNMIKNKKVTILPILIFISYYFLNAVSRQYSFSEITLFLFLHLVFFSEIFLFNQLLNNPYLRRRH